MNIQTSLDNIIFLILLVITIIYWASLIYSSFKPLLKIGFVGTGIVNAMLFCLLGSRWLLYGYFPLSNLYESLVFLAWGITFISTFLEYKNRAGVIGAISNPIALLLLASLDFLYPKVCKHPRLLYLPLNLIG